MTDRYENVTVEIEENLIFVPNYTKYIKYFLWTLMIKFFGGKYGTLEDKKIVYRWKRLFNHPWRFLKDDCIGSEYKITIKDKNRSMFYGKMFR